MEWLFGYLAIGATVGFFAGLLGIAGARAELSRQVDGAVAALAPFGARARLLAEAARYIATRKS